MDYPLFRNLFNELQAVVDPCDDIIDFGCGTMPLTRNLKCRKVIGIDAWYPYIEQLDRSIVKAEHFGLWHTEINDEFMNCISENCFDICIAIDFVEHLEKDFAIKFIEHMDRIAYKKVIIFTPKGFHKQKNQSEKEKNSEYQKHRCGFGIKEFIDRGYSIKIRDRGTLPSFLAIKNMI